MEKHQELFNINFYSYPNELSGETIYSEIIILSKRTMIGGEFYLSPLIFNSYIICNTFITSSV